MSRLRTATLPLALLALAIAASAEEKTKTKTPAPAPSAAPQAPAVSAGPAAVATVGDATITAVALDEKVGNRLMALRSQEYEIRRQGLEELIAEILLEKEAGVRGVSAGELLKQEVEDKVPPVPEADVKAQYERVKARVPAGMSEADALERISSEMRNRNLAQRRAELVQELRGRAGVRIHLDPPRVAVNLGDAPSKGPEGAPITILEFSDFQCPYCSRVMPTLKRIEERYGDKLRLVFRDFPLISIHPQAPKAAEAAACAHEQGKFWEMHDKLFADQGKLQVADLKQRATELGLDAERFGQCLDSGEQEADWKHDMDEGARYGVTGTPAFFINGRLLSGARPYEDFARIIDEELERAGVPVPPAQAPAPAPAPAPVAPKPQAEEK